MTRRCVLSVVEWEFNWLRYITSLCCVEHPVIEEAVLGTTAISYFSKISVQIISLYSNYKSQIVFYKRIVLRDLLTSNNRQSSQVD